jgi:hypothetical protein
MRHVTGFILAVVMAAALFFGGGWGVSRIVALQGPAPALQSVPGALALGALAGTGLLLGILLAVPGISPLGAGLPGILLLAWSGWLVVSPRRATALIPLHGTAYAGFATLLVSGILLLTGAVMIVPLFVPSRWRRRRYEDYDDIDVPEVIGLTR